jgi:hypothetical protein
MRDYEERFRVPARSLHQIFADIHGPNRTRRRRIRRLIAAAALAAMTAAAGKASHHAAVSPGNGSAHAFAFGSFIRGDRGDRHAFDFGEP